MKTQWLQWRGYAYAFGARLRFARSFRGFSQMELAQRSGVSRNQISNLERNDNNGRTVADPTLSTLYKLAKALDLPPIILMPGADGHVQENYQGDPHQLATVFIWPQQKEDCLPHPMAFHSHPNVEDFAAATLARRDVLLSHIGPQLPRDVDIYFGSTAIAHTETKEDATQTNS